MRPRTAAIVFTSFVAFLLAVAGVVYAYDDSRSSTIAQGITIGGVPVGGLTAAEAVARVERELVPVYREPLRVDHGDKYWTLGPREARLTVDISGSVRDALERSREGSIVTRTIRAITGGEIDASLEPAVEYSKDAVVRLLDKVRAGIERPAKNASIEYSATGLSKVEGRPGLAVKASELHEKLRAAIVSPTADRRLVAHTEKLEPKVTTDELAEKYPTILIADRGSFKLRVYKDLELAKTYPIAVGKAGHETPTGLYEITNKAVDPAWTVPNSDWAGDLAGKVIPGGAPNNPLKSRWLGIYAGVGIHGTDARGSVGSNASHGCLRMLIEDVEELYPLVPVGSPVYIA